MSSAARRLLPAAIVTAVLTAGCTLHDDIAQVGGPGPRGAATSTLTGSGTAVIPTESPTTPAASSPAPATPDPAITPPRIPAAGIATTNAVSSAKAWALAANSSSYLDPNAGTWTTRAKPFVTGNEAVAEQIQSRGGGGSTWAQIQTGKCVTSLQHLAAVIPSDAPTGPNRHIVYLTAITALSCGTGHVQLSQIAAQLTVIRIARRWLVADVRH